MRPGLRKRFYEKAAVAENDGAFAVTLDGKEVRTPARHSLAAPNARWRRRWPPNGTRSAT